MSAPGAIARTRFRQTLTGDQEQGLYEAMNKARTATRSVTVDKEALFALLVDHGRALHALEGGYESADGVVGP